MALHTFYSDASYYVSNSRETTGLQWETLSHPPLHTHAPAHCLMQSIWPIHMCWSFSRQSVFQVNISWFVSNRSTLTWINASDLILVLPPPSRVTLGRSTTLSQSHFCLICVINRVEMIPRVTSGSCSWWSMSQPVALRTCWRNSVPRFPPSFLKYFCEPCD